MEKYYSYFFSKYFHSITLITCIFQKKLLLLLCVTSTLAYPSFKSKMPNGASVPHPCKDRMQDVKKLLLFIKYYYLISLITFIFFQKKLLLLLCITNAFAYPSFKPKMPYGAVVSHPCSGHLEKDYYYFYFSNIFI